ncbi:MAG: MBL fold metallo-hydrolase [Ruminococcaceae bacterium]|nr:MBL fold metallo-hydrolase [Oscillospiraceae bacterium]
MARIFPICSSSSGNCTFIGTRGHGILVDAGCSFRAMKSSLELIETSMNQIEAIFITHEHIDHVKGLFQLTKHTKIPVFASPGTIAQLRRNVHEVIPEEVRIYDVIHEPYQSADFEVKAFHTPHDTPESVGFTVNFGGKRIAVCTDLGKITAEVEESLLGCEAVLLESNYDPAMLAKNLNYPADLKRRIAGEKGHLSNNAAADFSAKLLESGTTKLILGHLSRENNTPATAEKCFTDYLSTKGARRGRDYILEVAPVMTQGRYIAV